MANELQNNNKDESTDQNDKLDEAQEIASVLHKTCQKVENKVLWEFIRTSDSIKQNNIVEINNGEKNNYNDNSKKIKYSDSSKFSFLDFLKPKNSAHVIIYLAVPIFILSKIFMIKAVQSFFYISVINIGAFFKALGVKIAFFCKSTLLPMFAKITLATVIPYVIAISWLVSLALLIILLCKLSNNNNEIKPTVIKSPNGGSQLMPKQKNSKNKLEIFRPSTKRIEGIFNAPK